MNLNGRLNKIEIALAAFAGDDVPDELKQLRRRMFEPTNDEWWAACDSIAATMPEEYVRLLESDLKRLHDLNLSVRDYNRLDHYSGIPINRTGKPCPAPLTQRFFELVDFRIYQCPRPLELPEAFCRVLTELEPDTWLRFSEDCENCLLKHPVLYYHEERRIAWRRIFDKCALCGGKPGWQFLSPASRPCHDSVGSPYRRAMAGYIQTLGDDE